MLSMFDMLNPNAENELLTNSETYTAYADIFGMMMLQMEMCHQLLTFDLWRRRYSSFGRLDMFGVDCGHVQ
jgi:hypothetical protein